MEDMKITLKEIVAKRLSAAPESTAKAELIEELSENLYSRYADLTASGVSSDEARDRAVDALGDTDELVEYLKSLEPDQSLPELVLDPEKTDGGQIEEILHNVEGILRGAFQKAKSAFKEARDTVKESCETVVSDGETVETHMDDSDNNAEKEHRASELGLRMGAMEKQINELSAAIEAKEAEIEAAQEVLSKLETARDALEDVEDQSIVEGAIADLEVKIGAKEAEIERLEEEQSALEDEQSALEDEMAALEDELDALEEELDDESGDGKRWKVSYQDKSGHSVEFDSDMFKESMKGMMKDIEVAIRDATGMAKDITKSACKVVRESAAAACTPDTPVDLEQPISSAQLKGIDVQSVGGDITVRMSQAPDGDVLVGGDIDDIEVFRSENGVLTIRPIKTETTSFFFGRGIFDFNSSADVILDLPRRDWEFIKLATTNGDVELSGEFPVDQITLTSISGDLHAAIPSCGKVLCKTTNGDIRWTGDASELRVESISGDVQYRGNSDSVNAKTTSGDLTLEGGICAAAVRSISGDVCLRSSVMPGKMDIGTTSGDMWVDIPDGGPFTAKFRSTSGDFTSDFFTGRMGGRSCTFTYQGGGERQYSFASISGDVELRKFH